MHSTKHNHQKKKNLITTYNKKNTKSNNKNLQDETTKQQNNTKESTNYHFFAASTTNKANMSTSPLTTTSFSYISTMDFFVITLKLPQFVTHILSPKLDVFASFAIASIDTL